MHHIGQMERQRVSVLRTVPAFWKLEEVAGHRLGELLCEDDVLQC